MAEGAASGARIRQLVGEYAALASHNLPMSYQGLRYKSFDAARTAAKTDDPERRRVIGECPTAKQAVLAGGRHTGTVMREDWAQVRASITADIVINGIMDAPAAVQELLLATGGAILCNEHVHGQYQEETYSGGTQFRVGANEYGKALMAARETLRGARAVAEDLVLEAEDQASEAQEAAAREAAAQSTEGTRAAGAQALPCGAPPAANADAAGVPLQRQHGGDRPWRGADERDRRRQGGRG